MKKKTINIYLKTSYGQHEWYSIASEMIPVNSELVICRTDPADDTIVKKLRDTLLDSLLWLLPDSGYKTVADVLARGTVSASMPLALADNRLLVIAGDGVHEEPNTGSMDVTGFRMLPVFKVATPFKLSATYSAINAEWWEEQVEEIVPRLLSMLQLAPEEFRVFISYKRSDTLAVAQQLHDELRRKGAEVFLDSYTLSSGINFQRHLVQHLSDKGMVVALESTDLGKSPWVARELTFAKIYRLGFCAVNFDATELLPQVDTDNRRIVQDSDYKDNTLPPDKRELTNKALHDVIQFIKMRHAVAMINKHRYLSRSLQAMLGARMTTDTAGYADVSGRRGRYKVALNVRPSEARDYCRLHDALTAGMNGAIIGPRLHLHERRRINTWLARQSGIRFYDEGSMLQFINDIDK